MSADLVQLEQRDTSVFGRRYTDQDKAAAYLYWRTNAGKSCRKVALRFGIDHRTVLSWMHSDDWAARSTEEDRDDFASAHIGIAALVVNELVPNFELHREIRDNPENSPKDRMMAAQWMSGLGGVSPVSKIETAVTNNRSTVTELAPNFDDMSADQLRDYEHSIKRRKLFEPSAPVVNGSRAKTG